MHQHPPRQHVFRQPVILGTRVQATIKWYDPTRGFGFVKFEDGQPDALIPAAVVGTAGFDALPDGATVVVDVEKGRKGNQVCVLHSVDISTAARPRPTRERGFGDRPQGERRSHGDRGDRNFGDRGDRGFGDRGFGDRDRDRPAGAAPRRAAPSGPTTAAVGTVKWFNTTKGFGFIQPDGGGPDVFVHVKALERSGLSGLNEGQRVRLSIRQGDKGPEAASVEEA